MPRRDDLDETDDYRDDFSSDRPRKTTNPALILGLVLGGVLLLVLLVCGGFVAVFLFRGADAPAQVAVQQAAVADAAIVQPDPVPDAGPELAKPEAGATKPATLGRKDFEDKVRDKTRKEVIAAIGRPNETREKVVAYGKVFEGTRDTGKRVPYLYDWWIYRDRVINEATGKPYSEVRVRFNESGKADFIQYP